MNLVNWGVDLMTTVAFHTMGCKVNHYESEAMMDIFKNRDYNIVDFENKADIYVINSCTVTNSAASKSRKYARRAKRRNPQATVVMVGCYSQVSPEEVKNIEEIDLILGTDNKKDIVDIVEKSTDYEKKDLDNIVNYRDLTEYEDLKIENLSQTTRGYIKIEEGCNQFCSYCIIPYARGPVRSRKKESVLKEVKQLVDQGVKEIVLTGIHLGLYGYDWDQETALLDLIESIININKLGRVRLSSIEITEISDRLINLMAESPKICEHLHLPLQSGSDEILDKMNRPYTRSYFQKKVDKIRKKMPDIAITTDVMVGFPGEKEKHFQDTYDLIKNIGFSRLHVFPYSVRKGTPAADMSNKVPGDIKKNRSKKLRELNKKLMLTYQNRFIGKKRKIIIEEKRDYDSNLLTGITGNYLRVLLEGKEDLMGNMIEVKLTDSYNYEKVRGEVAKKKEL
mgnify:CR=1 FL=1